VQGLLSGLDTSASGDDEGSGRGDCGGRHGGRGPRDADDDSPQS